MEIEKVLQKWKMIKYNNHCLKIWKLDNYIYYWSQLQNRIDLMSFDLLATSRQPNKVSFIPKQMSAVVPFTPWRLMNELINGGRGGHSGGGGRRRGGEESISNRARHVNTANFTCKNDLFVLFLIGKTVPACPSPSLSTPTNRHKLSCSEWKMMLKCTF